MNLRFIMIYGLLISKLFQKIKKIHCRKTIPRIRWSFSFPRWQTIWRYEKVHIYLSVDISHHGMIILTLSTCPQRDNKPSLGCNWSVTMRTEKNWMLIAFGAERSEALCVQKFINLMKCINLIWVLHLKYSKTRQILMNEFAFNHDLRTFDFEVVSKN